MNGHPADLRTAGAWPFVTLRRYSHHGHRLLWRARQNRKGLLRAERGHEALAVPFWQSSTYNWIIGLVFAIGALLFMLGAGASLLPTGWSAAPSGTQIAVIFFLGSIPFTTAGYLQHFQAANAADFRPDPKDIGQGNGVALIGWHPNNPGWLSTFAQFIGTVAFNFNTFDAITAPSQWVLQDLAIWGPGMIGSLLFLLSGYLAFIEVCHGYWAWKPKDLDWTIVSINLLGCVFFLISSLLAFVPPHTEPGWIPVAANALLWLGALCFFIGAVLLMRESAQARKTGASAPA
ncbi:hypothetical protein AB0T83_06380 [Fluviibacterium sp. DFM31]|uniref:YrhK domain-containing protein n=1 Tax=Meridianimarinicoccus marinus TaxID=3231483 RepID=A0ABV3L7Q9_9RHOB